MNIKTSTSTLVLTLLMTSPAVMAMDPPDLEELSPPKAIVPSLASSSTDQDLQSATPSSRRIQVSLEKVSEMGMTENIVVAKSNGIVTVLSDNRMVYTYQLTTNRFSVRPEERIKVTYNITADAEETIGLDFLNSRRDNWYRRAKPFLLKKGKQMGTFETVVPERESETSLIFYSALATSNSTQFTIYSLKIEVHPPFTSTPARTRFSRLTGGVFDTSPEPSLVPSSTSSSTYQDLQSAIPLSRVIQDSLKKATEGAVVAKSGRIVTVLSDNTTLHKCQVETDRFLVTPGERIKITYNITADKEGTIGLDFLNSKRNDWYRRTMPFLLKEGKQTGTFEAIVPEGESETSLMFYNNRISFTSTQFTIHNLKIEILPPLPSAPPKTWTSLLTLGYLD